MRITKERLARLALLWSEAVGSGGLSRLVTHFGSGWLAINARREELASPSLRLRPEQIAIIATLPARLEAYEQQWRECERRFMRVVFSDDVEYPKPLLEIPNAPAVLTIYGSWLPADDPAVAIVGSRVPTGEGNSLAEELARACARYTLTVVSGLAQGVDQAAHGGALKAQGRTIAVVGCGLLAIPRKMTGGMEKAIAEQGAVMSELGPYSKASIPHIMARNRLISGLSRAVIVVQSRRRGGALVTADYARKQGRLVYAVPWPKGLPQGDGTAQLMRDGAQPISGPGDVAQLATQLGMVPPKAPQQLPLIDDL